MENYYNGTELYDELDFIYKNIVNVNFIIGGVILITTLTNMSLLCTMRTKINNISRMVIPPTYK